MVDTSIVKGGGGAPHPHQTWLILLPLLNVCQKVGIASLVSLAYTAQYERAYPFYLHIRSQNSSFCAISKKLIL